MKAHTDHSRKTTKWLRVVRGVIAILSLAAYKVIRVGLVVTVVASLVAYFGEWLTIFDFAAQLRLQWLVGAVVGLVFTLGKREWYWSAIALLGISLNFWPIVRWYVPKEKLVSTERRLKLVQYNVLFQNNRYQELLEFLREERPDIVALQEVTPEWVAGLAPLSAQFADWRIEPRYGGSGIAVYSRMKFAQAETLDFGGAHQPNLLVKFLWESRPISLMVTHPPSPFGENRFDWRNEQVASTTGFLKSLSGPKILIGDLNLTMWSPYYQNLVSEAQLVNTREGHGLLPTWNAHLRFPFLMIPIDHCLVSRDFQVAAIRTGRKLSSDHLPLVVELIVP